MGWQINSRQPSKLGCFLVAVRFPSTRAKSIGNLRSFELGYSSLFRISNFEFSIDPQVVHHDTSAYACERLGIRNALTRRRRHRVTQIALSSQPEARHGRPVLHEQRR